MRPRSDSTTRLSARALACVRAKCGTSASPPAPGHICFPKQRRLCRPGAALVIIANLFSARTFPLPGTTGSFGRKFMKRALRCQRSATPTRSAIIWKPNTKLRRSFSVRYAVTRRLIENDLQRLIADGHCFDDCLEFERVIPEKPGWLDFQTF